MFILFRNELPYTQGNNTFIGPGSSITQLHHAVSGNVILNKYLAQIIIGGGSFVIISWNQLCMDK